MWYTAFMAKNLTLALDDRLLERAREYAYSRDLTLNSLIRKLLTDAVDPAGAGGPDSTFRLMDEALPQPSQGTWRREDLYDRLK
jgi:hypothetical protein